MTFEDFKSQVESAGLVALKTTKNFRLSWEIHGQNAIEIINPNKLTKDAVSEIARAIKLAKGEKSFEKTE